jgi:hypothetical protein
LDTDPNSDDGSLVQRTVEEIISSCNAVMRVIAESYVAAVKVRFPSMPLLEHFDVFNPTKLKGVSSADAAAYGNDAVKALAEHYGTVKKVDVPGGESVEHAALLDKAKLINEWEHIRPVLLRKAARLTTVMTAKVFVSFYAEVLSDLMDTYPVVCSLIMIMLVLPAHTAEVERGFSMQNLIKSKFRAAMHVKSLDTLMRIKLLGPASVNPADVAGTAIDLNAITVEWHSKKNRMPQRSNVGVARKADGKAAATPAAASAGAAETPAAACAGAAEHSLEEGFAFEDVV